MEKCWQRANAHHRRRISLAKEVVTGLEIFHLAFCIHPRSGEFDR
jgi:hypothetical protein